MTKIELMIVACIVALVSTTVFVSWNDDQSAVRCFEGFKYKVGSDGALHLMTTGKTGVSVRCD